MKDGDYEVIEFIHVYSCMHGHLKASEGTKITIKGSVAIADNKVRFPSILLTGMESHLKRIS